MNKRLIGRVALVTDGDCGVGRAIAEKLASQGVAVMVASRADQQLNDVVATIEEGGGRAAYVECDVSDPMAVQRALKVTEEKFGHIDFLVSNAGHDGLFGEFGGVFKAGNMSASSIDETHITLTGHDANHDDIEKIAVEGFTIAVQPGATMTRITTDALNDSAVQQHLPWVLDILRAVSEEQSDWDMQQSNGQSTEYVVRVVSGGISAFDSRYADDMRSVEQLQNRQESALDLQQLEHNKQLVLAFNDAAINQKDFSVAQKYMSPNYIQHNPTAQTGPAGLRDWITQFKIDFPDARLDVKTVIAEGDRVVLHSHGVNGPLKNGAVIVDIFRVENGLVAEHWDVIQAIPDSRKNTNSMF